MTKFLSAKLFIVFLVLVFLSCKTKEEKESITLHISEKTVSTNGASPQSYNKFSVLEDALVAYNRNSHALDIFDLNSKRQVNSISLQRKGPNEIENLKYLSLISQDSILIVENKSFLIYSLSQNQVLDVYYPLRIIGSNKGFINDQIAYFNKSFIVSKSISTANKRIEEYQREIFTVINLDKSYKKLPLVFPEHMQNGDFYPTIDIPFYFTVDDLLVYNFHNSPEIYSYNLKSGDKRVYQGTLSEKMQRRKPIPPADSNDLQKIAMYFFDGFLYTKPLYDKHRKLYYRISDHNSWESKSINVDSYLTIFDESFQVLYEAPLPFQHYSTTFSFVTKEGLWVCTKGKEDELTFKVISVNQEK